MQTSDKEYKKVMSLIKVNCSCFFVTIAHFWYSGWGTMHKTAKDEAPGKSKNDIRKIPCFPGASFSIGLSGIHEETGAKLKY